MSAQRVLVVGAGIIGSSIAWHLAMRGAKVTVIDTNPPGGTATAASWAWINASWGNPEPYFRLRARAMAEWHRAARDLPPLDIAWTGGLLWDIEGDALETYASTHAAWGYDIRLVDAAEVQRLEPALRAAPARAVHVPSEGAVDPVAAARSFLNAAEALGATFRRGTATRLVTEGERITGLIVDGTEISADHVVLAAGTHVPQLAATAGVEVPLDQPPGLLVRSAPLAPCLNGLVMAPELHVRQLHDGRLLAGADFGGSDPGDDALATAHAVIADLQRLLRPGAAIQYESYSIGLRPLPRDGFPIVGWAGGRAGLYLAVTHSGVTLAPALGLFAAAEILVGKRDPLLAPYGPDRFG